MKLVISLALLMTSFIPQSFAQGVGYSVHPMSKGRGIISGEISGVTTNEGGVGFISRYTHRILRELVADAGAEISTGDRRFKLFVGGDYTIFPDYAKQPRVSLKTTYEFSRQFGDYYNTIEFAPVVSKGIAAYGQELFPFISFPIGLNLNGEDGKYGNYLGLNLGASAPIDLPNGDTFNVNFEVSLDLNDYYTGFIAGLSYSL